MDADKVYLHGFTRDGRSVGQNGPFFPDQSLAIEQGGNALKRFGAHRIVRVAAADPATATALAEESLRESRKSRESAELTRVPWSVRDYLVYAVVAVSRKVWSALARLARRRRR